MTTDTPDPDAMPFPLSGSPTPAEWDAALNGAVVNLWKADAALLDAHDALRTEAATNDEKRRDAAALALAKSEVIRAAALAALQVAMDQRRTCDERLSTSAATEQARALVVWTRVLAGATACLILATFASAFIAR